MLCGNTKNLSIRLRHLDNNDSLRVSSKKICKTFSLEDISRADARIVSLVSKP